MVVVSSTERNQPKCVKPEMIGRKLRSDVYFQEAYKQKGVKQKGVK